MVFFNASTRLLGLSLNAAFQLAAAWAVRLAGVPVIHFVCQGGMSRCVLGTDRENPQALPPCPGCIAQSARCTRTAKRTGLSTGRPRPGTVLQRLDLPDADRLRLAGRTAGRLVPARAALDAAPASPGWMTSRPASCSASTSSRPGGWRRSSARCWTRSTRAAVVVFNGMFYPEAAARWAGAAAWAAASSRTRSACGPSRAFFTTGEATAYPIHIPEEFQLIRRAGRAPGRLPGTALAGQLQHGGDSLLAGDARPGRGIPGRAWRSSSRWCRFSPT